MQPITGYVREAVVSILEPVSINTMLANAVSVALHGTRTAAAVPRINDGMISTALDSVWLEPDHWSGAATTGASGRSYVFDMRERFSEAMQLAVSGLIGALLSDRHVVDDYGACTLERLLRPVSDAAVGTNWRAMYVGGPPFGYARRGLEYVCDLPPFEGSTKPYPNFMVPSPWCEWSKGIARALATIDLCRMSRDLLPKPAQTSASPFRSKPYGEFDAWREIHLDVQSTLSMYPFQGPLLYAHVHARAAAAGSAYARAYDADSTNFIDRLDALLARIRSQQLHPLISYIASAMQTGSIRSFHGVKPQLWCQKGSELVSSADEPLNAAAPCGAETTVALANRYLDAAYGLFDPRTGGSACRVRSWSDKPSVEWISYQDLMTLIDVGKDVTSRWAQAKARLGWVDLTADVGEQDAYGADFIVTDGEWFSRPPAAAVLGLSPLVHLGNISAMGGVFPRYKDSWNVRVADDDPALITWSALPVMGRVGQGSGSYQLERMFMPAGMSMGEEGFIAISETGALESRLGREVTAHYAAQGQIYARVYYSVGDPPPNTPAGVVAVRTDWDPVVYGVQAEQVRDVWTAWLERSGEGTPVARMPYYYREGKLFATRVPVRMARGPSVILFSEYGRRIGVMPFEGHVMFNGDVSLNVSGEAVEKLASAIDVSTDLSRTVLGEAIAAKSEIKPGTAL